MKERSTSSEHAVRAAILRDVYRDNLASGKRLQPRAGRRRALRWLGFGAAVLLSCAVALVTVLASMTESRVAAPGAGNGAATRIADTLPPLITDARAGVAAGPGKGMEWSGRLDRADDYRALLRQDAALAGLFGLEVRTIVIDPGHGGDDPGAIGANGLQEKDVTLDIARLLHARLRDAEGINVVLTRDTDVTLSLRQRVEYAQQLGADLLISIHLNTIPNDPMTIVETYYFGTSSDTRSLKVAGLENRHSGYAVAEFDRLIAQFGDALKQQESRKLAAHIQRSVYGTLRRGNRQIIDAGIKSAPFVVLLGDGIPSVLAEVTCISNTAEEALLATSAYRDRIAGALERGVLSYLDQLREQRRQWPEEGSSTYAESQG